MCMCLSIALDLNSQENGPVACGEELSCCLLHIRSTVSDHWRIGQQPQDTVRVYDNEYINWKLPAGDEDDDYYIYCD